MFGVVGGSLELNLPSCFFFGLRGGGGCCRAVADSSYTSLSLRVKPTHPHPAIQPPIGQPGRRGLLFFCCRSTFFFLLLMPTWSLCLQRLASKGAERCRHVLSSVVCGWAAGARGMGRQRGSTRAKRRGCTVTFFCGWTGERVWVGQRRVVVVHCFLLEENRVLLRLRLVYWRSVSMVGYALIQGGRRR